MICNRKVGTNKHQLLVSNLFSLQAFLVMTEIKRQYFVIPRVTYPVILCVTANQITLLDLNLTVTRLKHHSGILKVSY